jgi:hypothetical protein
MTTLNRRAVLSYAGVGAVALGAAPLFARRADAQEQDVNVLLQESAAAMSALSSFTFELETVNGTSTILDNLELKKVAGSVKRPDSFMAAVTAGIAVVDLTVQVVGIGQRLWVTDPLDEEGRFIELSLGDDASGAGSLAALINPDRVFLTAVGLVENAAIDGTEKIDGVETTVVTGEFDAGKLVSLASPTAGEDASLEGSGFPAELILDRMPVTIWIDEAKRVVRLEIEGPLTSSESTDVIRGIDFFDFDELVEIPEPTNVAPAT